MKTKLLAIATFVHLATAAFLARADEPTFETLTRQVADLPARDYAGRWPLLQQAAPLAVRPDQQLALAVLQGDASARGGHAADAPGYYQAALTLATEPSLRSTTAVKLARVYLEAHNPTAAQALATAETESHPDDATSYGLQALLNEATARDSATWLAAAALREQERQKWAGIEHRWQWSALLARLKDLKKAGQTDAEINAIAIPLLTAGNVTFTADFGGCVALVNRVLLARADLRNHLQTLLQSVTATPDEPTTRFRGILAAQLAALPPDHE